jgi:inhibitor of KinA sporulation pathway (predicted exonuclease)
MNSPPEIFTSLDLEMNQPSGKIIQIGAVVGNITTGFILDKLSVIVNPNEELNPFIVKLTGISQHQVNCGEDLQIAYGKLCMMHIKHAAFHSPITWGNGDVETLKQQVAVGNNSQFLFGRRYFDSKTLFQAYCLAYNVANASSGGKMKLQSGLAKSMIRVGLNFKGRKHNAADDAENTFVIFHHMLKLMTLKDAEMIQALYGKEAKKKI